MRHAYAHVQYVSVVSWTIASIPLTPCHKGSAAISNRAGKRLYPSSPSWALDHVLPADQGF